MTDTVTLTCEEASVCLTVFNEYIQHVDCWLREHGISAVSDPSYVRVIQTRDQLIKALEDVIIEKELEEK